MNITLHKNARTTPAVRAELQRSTGTTDELARRHGVSWKTAHRWRHADDGVNDRSHRPRRIKATLSQAQESVVLVLREQLRIGLDDLLAVVREFIEPEMSRSALGRMLKRHKAPSLRDLCTQDAAAAGKPVKKSFKDYEPGFIHMDIKYLPKLEGEDSRRYLFVAIDRASRWVFYGIYDDQSEASSTDFLEHLIDAAPMKIVKLLTDNGSQFTDRFTSKRGEPSGEHAFDKVCEKSGIEHRLIPPRHPQTNGMVERFNGRISEILHAHHFDSSASLKATLDRYLWHYNHRLPQRALGHIAPVDALRKWQKQKPELFKKQIENSDNQPGLDSYAP
jgi:transposase InsO family protein